MKTILFNTSLFSLICIIPLLAAGQNISVCGYVSNKIDGSYLENVSIYESGSIIGTITDKNGFYKLILPAGAINLSATLQGYQDFKKQMNVDCDTVFSIQLKPKIDKKNTSKGENSIQALKNGDDKPKKKLHLF
jgi:hypothetical protein